MYILSDDVTAAF